MNQWIGIFESACENCHLLRVWQRPVHLTALATGYILACKIVGGITSPVELSMILSIVPAQYMLLRKTTIPFSERPISIWDFSTFFSRTWVFVMQVRQDDILLLKFFVNPFKVHRAITLFNRLFLRE